MSLWSLAEGPAMLFIGVVGTLLNVLCLIVLSHNKELKLAKDYLFLLRAQSVMDLLYLLTSTPVTALRSPTFRHLHQPLFLLPWVFPFVQITMIASIYNTIALAVERYLSIRSVSTTHSFPTKVTIALIAIVSFLINIPRFFELGVVHEEKRSLKEVNNTGILEKDYIILVTEHEFVKPTAGFYTLGYFLGYNLIGSFLISLFIPIVLLSVFNMLIWRRLKQIWSNQSHLGIQEKRNTKAAFSLVLIIIMFFVCHSMKLVVSMYQLVDTIVSPSMDVQWPHWVEVCTFISHFLLALNASVNILIFCSCDKRFLAVVGKMLRSWFTWFSCLKSCNPAVSNIEEPANIEMKQDDVQMKLMDQDDQEEEEGEKEGKTSSKALRESP